MSKHRYRTDEELEEVRKLATLPLTLTLLDEIDALRAELKAAQEDIAQLKIQLHQAEIERNMASDCVKSDGEQISQLTRERDHSVDALLEVQGEIARLREENARLRENASIPEWLTWGQLADAAEASIAVKNINDELDRMREALEEIAEWAKDGPTIPRDIATRALNPQPAQQAPVSA